MVGGGRQGRIAEACQSGHLAPALMVRRYCRVLSSEGHGPFRTAEVGLVAGREQMVRR